MIVYSMGTIGWEWVGRSSMRTSLMMGCSRSYTQWIAMRDYDVTEGEK